MKKALVCLLAITLVLFFFTACDISSSSPDENSSTGGTTTPSPTPNPETIQPANSEQTTIFQNVTGKMGYALSNKLYENDPNAPTGVDSYIFKNVECKDETGKLIGVLNGTFTNELEKECIDLTYIDYSENSAGITNTLYSTFEKVKADTYIFIINGVHCLIFWPGLGI